MPNSKNRTFARLRYPEKWTKINPGLYRTTLLQLLTNLPLPVLPQARLAAASVEVKVQDQEYGRHVTTPLDHILDADVRQVGLNQSNIPLQGTL